MSLWRPAKKKKIKTSVTLPREVLEKLQTMSSRSGSSVSDVVRRAIHTEHLLRDTRKRGGRVLIQNRDNSVREVVFRRNG
jgi:metal-responsive CopG/Arc/MetJ family transcriptional regulator